MTLQQIDYMNARRDAKPASGGTNYASREHSRLAETARQRDSAMNDGERSAEAAWQAVTDLQRELQTAREMVERLTANGENCPVCRARRETQAARVARHRQRNKERKDNDAIPF